MKKQKNIFLTALGETRDRLRIDYYVCEMPDGNLRFTTGISIAEAGMKYMLSQHRIDEIIMMGSSAWADSESVKDSAIKDVDISNIALLDGMSEYERYKEWFRTELELDILALDHPTEKETLDGILDILAETCSTNRKMIRIAGDDKPKEVVKGRLMKLDSLHIQYVLDCLNENTSEVKNIKQYLLTTLFNAPVTISPYYQNRVNHDMHGGRSSSQYNGKRRSAFDDYSYTGSDSF